MLWYRSRIWWWYEGRIPCPHPGPALCPKASLTLRTSLSLVFEAFAWRPPRNQTFRRSSSQYSSPLSSFSRARRPLRGRVRGGAGGWRLRASGLANLRRDGMLEFSRCLVLVFAEECMGNSCCKPPDQFPKQDHVVPRQVSRVTPHRYVDGSMGSCKRDRASGDVRVGRAGAVCAVGFPGAVSPPLTGHGLASCRFPCSDRQKTAEGVSVRDVYRLGRTLGTGGALMVWA